MPNRELPDENEVPKIKLRPDGNPNDPRSPIEPIPNKQRTDNKTPK